jgi:hypothetical protein
MKRALWVCGLLLLTAAFLLAACAGEEGAQGPPDPEGPAGPPGTEGP